MPGKRENVLDFIGNTPAVPVKRLNPNPKVEILAKLEYFNPGGSVKDRPALFMIEEAERRGELTREKIILEATSGNTGIGLALVAAVKGYRILLTMSEAVSEERIKILRALGADIQFTPARMSTDGAIEYVYKLIREEPDKYWLADQFNNEANWMAHYHGTAMEIWEQTGGVLDAIVATMGTTGTLMGISRRFKELKPGIRIVGVEPYLGHKIQGLKNMKESYQPGIFQKGRLDRIIHIDDDEAFETSRLLARKEGLFVGMSSGAAMAAAVRLAREMDQGRIVVILPDGGERYLSTSLFLAKKKSGLRVYNTMTRQREDFIPIKENRVGMYSCGPTLCQPIHVGQCRLFVLSDLIRRYLELKGYQVTHIMNVTDLDDRTIHGAEAAGESLKAFTSKYHEAFLKDLEWLNVDFASEFPKASDHVEYMIEITQQLLEKGYAYEKFRSIYFDISRFAEYGKLSRIDLEKIQLGKTVDLDQYEKENPRDFTLFKRSTLGELKKGLFFQTRWGNVRPSWHLECSAMALKYLGPTYDIHLSGMDLVFPHHENAIAIGHAVTGRPLANYWIHNELVTVDGNRESQDGVAALLTIDDLKRRGFTGREIRYWLISRHYRKPIFFSWANLNTARNTVAHIDQFVQKLFHAPSGPSSPDLDQLGYDLRHTFTEAMDDDLNIAKVLAALFKFIHRMNVMMDRFGLSRTDRDKVLATLENIDRVLDVMELRPMEADRQVETLAQEREDARKGRDWEKADRLRRQIREMGFEVTDTKEGPLLRKAPETGTE
jgi:cysteinyl-tRNA synthetase